MMFIRNLDLIAAMPNRAPHPMFARIGNVLLVFALLAATGTHWAVLQSVAWTTMLADNLRATSLTEAVERTFDGKHPCGLCQRIAAGKSSERKSECPPSMKKLEFLSATPRFVFSHPTRFCRTAVRFELLPSVISTPPTPPPRGLGV